MKLGALGEVVSDVVKYKVPTLQYHQRMLHHEILSQITQRRPDQLFTVKRRWALVRVNLLCVGINITKVRLNFI
jgi:hypothetical protein